MLNPVFIDATTIQDAYFQMLYKILDHGIKYEITEGSMKGDFRLEFPFAAGFIRYPHTRPLAPIMPEGILPTTTDEKIEKYFANELMDPNLAVNEEYRYAVWINGEFYNPWRYKSSGGWETQLNWCIRHFKEKGFGNAHCYITIGDPTTNFRYDAPYSNETERKTSPCLRGLDIKIKEGLVILGIEYRSWDMYSGFPENMGGFSLLNTFIADELGVKPGPLAFSSAGLHCYGSQVKAVHIATHREN